MTFITRMIFLDEANVPSSSRRDEGTLAPVKVVAARDPSSIPKVLRAASRGSAQVPRRDPRPAGGTPVASEKIPAGNSAHLHFISFSGFLEEEQEYWVYLEVDEGSVRRAAGPRQPGRCRLPDREHAQQPDRGGSNGA